MLINQDRVMYFLYCLFSTLDSDCKPRQVCVCFSAL